MYVCLSVSSGGFDIHGYSISFDGIRHIFIGVDGILVFYEMEIHFCNYHSYDSFYPHFCIFSWILLCLRSPMGCNCVHIY